jgi:hypothetical protein
MFKRLGIGVLAVAAVLMAGTKVRADATSDIKDSGRAFLDAMTAGDLPAMNKYSVTDDKSEKFLEVWSEVAKANKKMVDAAVSKFGDDGNQITNSSGMGMRKPQIIQHFENAKIDVNGDTAVVTPTTGKPVNMKKDGGKWKVDLTNQDQFAKIDQQVVFFHKMAEANAKSAQEISDGKYKTLDEAKAGVRNNMMEAIRSAMPTR